MQKTGGGVLGPDLLSQLLALHQFRNKGRDAKRVVWLRESGWWLTGSRLNVGEPFFQYDPRLLAEVATPFLQPLERRSLVGVEDENAWVAFGARVQCPEQGVGPVSERRAQLAALVVHVCREL